MSVAATVEDADQGWLSEFAARTPDIFVLDRFLRPSHRPLFLRALIESRRPDAVMITNSEMGYHLLPYLRAVCPEPAYLDFCHIEEEDWKSGGYPRYAVSSREQLDLSVVVSDHLKQWMVERGADASRVEVCTINVDPDYWKMDPDLRARIRGELGIENDVPVLLYAARLCAQKQPRVFADAIRQTSAENKNFLALVVGDGEDAPWLRAFIRKHGLGDVVRMLGSVDSARVRELLSASDLLFLPSKWEGISLAIYEAMAAGVAVLGADVGGQRELLTPDCGTLLPRSDPTTEARGYAGALIEMLSDLPRLRAMGERGRERVEQHFHIDAMGERMQALIRHAIELSRTSPRQSVPLSLAHELGVRGMEFIRLQKSLERALATPPAAPTKPKRGRRRTPTPKAPKRRAPKRAVRELEAIESSRAWRAVRRLKRNPAYRAIARARWGEGWERRLEMKLPPRQRLAEIKASRSYRLIHGVKSTPPYRWYARRKNIRHGS